MFRLTHIANPSKNVDARSVPEERCFYSSAKLQHYPPSCRIPLQPKFNSTLLEIDEIQLLPRDQDFGEPELEEGNLPIRWVAGNLFANVYKVEAFAQGCNCQGSMGAGIAKGFRERYPKMSQEYRSRCNRQIAGNCCR